MWDEFLGIILTMIIAVPLFCIAVFALWIRYISFATGETAATYWDVFVKLISAFTVIIGGAMLLGQYMEQQKESTEREQVRADREIALREVEYLRQKVVFDTAHHERKRALLGEAKVTAASLATDASDENARQRFEVLFHADLIGMEKLHGPVEREMVKFRRALESNAGSNKLRKLSLDLSTAVETEMKESEEKILMQWERISRLIAPQN